MSEAEAAFAFWLQRLEALDPTRIRLGLERVGAVAKTLGIGRPAPTVITVAGTNGKGSTCAMLEAILRAAGFRTGLYTSPHLLRFEERARINGVSVSPESLIEQFEAVDFAAHATEADATDDAGLMELLGEQVEMVDGDPVNLKITSPSDLAVAAALLHLPAGSGADRQGAGD